jgi:sugar phosphate isomerase/epimerase
VPDAQALHTPFAEETGTHLLAMLRAAARARLGHDAPTALAEIAAHARELRGAAATVGLEPVATAAHSPPATPTRSRCWPTRSLPCTTAWP